MMVRRKTAGGMAAALLAMTLAPLCAAAQAPGTGTIATSPEQNAPVLQQPVAPEKKKREPEDGGLTFLPELKPTDGVVNLAQQKGGDAQIASEAGAMHEKPMLLDRAVAVINGEVILASDVR
jgi:hypothetical protein